MWLLLLPFVLLDVYAWSLSSCHLLPLSFPFAFLLTWLFFFLVFDVSYVWPVTLAACAGRCLAIWSWHVARGDLYLLFTYHRRVRCLPYALIPIFDFFFIYHHTSLSAASSACKSVDTCLVVAPLGATPSFFTPPWLTKNVFSIKCIPECVFISIFTL